MRVKTPKATKTRGNQLIVLQALMVIFCDFSRWHSLILLFDTSEGEEEGDPELSTRELIQQFGLGLRPRRKA